jgi:hypothetical protein
MKAHHVTQLAGKQTALNTGWIEILYYLCIVQSKMLLGICDTFIHFALSPVIFILPSY